LVISRDITEIKDAERRLEASRAELRELATHRETAREEERARIARELHDELGQFLSALRLQISELRMRFGPDNPGVLDRAKVMLTLVDRIIHVTRDLVASLRPVALDMGIGAALEWLARQITDHSGVVCELNMEEEAVSLDAHQTNIVFRIVQESLTNVARHSRATAANISLERSGGEYVLTVEDNGVGFDPTRREPKSLGLLGLKERANMLGGRIEIRSAPDAGTTIVVAFPALTVLAS